MKISNIPLFSAVMILLAALVACGGGGGVDSGAEGGGGGGGSVPTEVPVPTPEAKAQFSEWVGEMMEIDGNDVVVDLEVADVDETDSDEEGAFDGLF